jgi:hypothetical protein
MGAGGGSHGGHGGLGTGGTGGGVTFFVDRAALVRGAGGGGVSNRAVGGNGRNR